MSDEHAFPGDLVRSPPTRTYDVVSRGPAGLRCVGVLYPTGLALVLARVEHLDPSMADLLVLAAGPVVGWLLHPCRPRVVA